MHIQDIEVIIVKYLSGENTAEEAKILENWMYESPENKEYLKSYGKANKLALDALHIEERPILEIKSFKRYSILRYAAAACAILLMSLGVWKLISNKTTSTDENFAQLIINGDQILNIDPSKSYHLSDNNGIKIAEINLGKIFIKENSPGEDLKINVPSGKKLTVILPDSTQVSLNSASVLSLASNFNNSNKRMVNLSGEGFFSVTKNLSKPFYVYTDRFVTEVLGTKFNINSYNKDRKSSVILVEGKIAVKPVLKNNSSIAEVVLKPGESLLFRKNAVQPEKNAIKKPFDKTIWINNEIVFENEEVVDILSNIERVYNIKIHNKNTEINNKLYSGKFKDESLQNVMKTITSSLGCSYDIKNGEVFIYPNKRQENK